MEKQLQSHMQQIASLQQQQQQQPPQQQQQQQQPTAQTQQTAQEMEKLRKELQSANVERDRFQSQVTHYIAHHFPAGRSLNLFFIFYLSLDNLKPRNAAA